MSGSLDATQFFFLACREAFRDGRVDAAEKVVLAQLQKALGLDNGQATQVARKARERAEAKGFEADSRLDPDKLIRRARAMVKQAGAEADPESRALLKRFQAILAPQPAPPKAAPAPKAAPPPKPAPAPAPAPEGAPEPEAPPAGSDLVPQPQKKQLADAGGAEESTLPMPLGDPHGWGFHDILAMPFRAAQRSPGPWGAILALEATVGSIPLLNLLTMPVTSLLTAVAVADEARGDPPQSFGELWSRCQGRIAGMYVTGLAAGFALFLAALLGGVIFAGASATGSAAVSALTVISLTVAGIWVFLRTVLYATQVAALEGRTGFDALRGSHEAISANTSGLIGGKAIGLFFAIGFLDRSLTKMMMALSTAVLIPLLGPGLGGFAVLFLVTSGTAPTRIYHTASWTSLYLQGRRDS